jgi:protein ImuB
VDRLACVDLPALPLQLLLRRHPEWRGLPVAVVDEDRPQGEILWVNEAARRSCVLPGQRYAQGLSLASELRAAEVNTAEIERTVARLTRQLRDFSPDVEPSTDEPGLFWLDASGLRRLVPSLKRWAGSIRAALEQAGFAPGCVVVGFSRFGSYALARSEQDRSVFISSSAEEERALSRQIPLSRLGLAPKLRDALDRLGIKSVGQLLALPAEGLHERFGVGAYRLHRLAAGRLWDPLKAEAELPALSTHADLEQAETDVTRLLFLLKRGLDRLLREAAARSEALSALELRLGLEDRQLLVERLCPAEPTLDGAQLLELLRLRLGRVSIAAGVESFTLVGEGLRATEEQLQLFAQQPRRDPAAADRALARLRAELGDRAVTCAALRPRHLPEASFEWAPLSQLPPARGPAPRLAEPPLVRRLYREPRVIPTPGAATALRGPFILSGGWWRQEVQREYHFASRVGGALEWIYYDAARQRWLLHGGVE